MTKNASLAPSKTETASASPINVKNAAPSRSFGGKKTAGNAKKNAIAKFRNARSMMLCGITLDDLGEIAVRIERKGKIHLVAFQYAGQPIRIVGPHVVVRDVFDLKPLRSHFFGFYRIRSGIIANEENVDVLIPFGLLLERKMEDAHFFEFRIRNVDSRFFAELADGRGFDGLARFDFAAGAVPFSFSETPLFHGEKDFVLRVEDEDERGLAHARDGWKYVRSVPISAYLATGFENSRKRCKLKVS